MGDYAQRSQSLTCAVVLLHHHSHRIDDRAEHCRRWGLACQNALFHAGYIGEKDLLLFHQVHAQLFRERREYLLNLQKFWMVLTTCRKHLR